MKAHQNIKKTSQTNNKISSNPSVDLPYFDELLGLLEQGHGEVGQSFGRHVHWGYWPEPSKTIPSSADFSNAAEELSQQVCIAAAIENGLSVLDVGCGFGGTIAHLNENHVGLSLVGLNLDHRQLQRAKQIVLPQGDNQVVFQQGNACHLPYKNHSFDRVLAVECIFHFPSRQDFFAEAYRVLKPGGFLALSDFVPHPIIAPFTKAKLPKMFGVGFYGRCNVQCTATAYRQLAQSTGFQTLTERDVTGNTLPTYNYLHWLARQQMSVTCVALLETIALEYLSRLKLLNYYIYGFQKPY